MKLLEQCLRETFEGDDPDFCITLEYSHDTNSWIQLTWDTFNFAYPLIEEPLQALSQRGIQLPPDVTLASWEPNRFVTFEHGAEAIGELASFIEAFLIRVLQIESGEQELTVIRESL